MTQTDINNAVNGVVNQYTGQTIAYYGTYPGECTVPVAYYVEKITGHSPVPSMANARADGWGVAFPEALAPFFTHEAYQPGKAYPKGTILIWNSPHIAIVLSSDGSNTVEVFEQNADPDGSPCGSKSRVVNNSFHTCTYALIPIVQTAPPPNPVTYEDVTPYTMVTAHDPTNWYALGNTTTDINNFTVITTLPVNTDFLVGGLGRNANFPYTYAMSPEDYAAAKAGDMTHNNGINLLDLKDVPLAPPVVTSTSLGSYIPTTVKPAQTYTLVTTVPTYDSSGYASNNVNPSGTFPAGTYYVYDQQNDLYQLNIVNTAQKASCKWVNGRDNVLPAPPVIPETPVITNAGEADETWKATYKAFNPANTPITLPVQYKVNLTYTVVDLDNKRANMQITAGKYIDVYGTFVKDGITYYRPRRGDDTTFDNWYGIPVFDTYVGQAILTKLMPTKPIKKTSLRDKLYEVKQIVENDEVYIWDIIPKWYKALKRKK